MSKPSGTIEFINIDEGMSSSEIMAVLKGNSRTALLLSSEIARLKSINAMQGNRADEDILGQNVSSSLIEEETDDLFKEIFKKYWDIYKTVKSDELDDLEEILPNEYEYRYQDILRRLISESFSTIAVIKELIAQCGDSVDLLEQLDLEKRKIKIVRDVLMEDEMEEETENEDYGEGNDIILVPNANGKIQVLDELNDIDESYYYRIYDMLQSIVKGNFKFMRKFTTIDINLAGFSEVKRFKVRVLYRRIDKNKYAIISVFIKKNDTDRKHKEHLNTMVAMFKKIESTGILSNPEFLKENSNNVLELWNVLSKSSQVKNALSEDNPIVKKKVGDE